MPEVYSTFALIAVLCHVEAEKLYASKAAFDELGVRLVVAVHQMPKPKLEVITHVALYERPILCWQALVVTIPSHLCKFAFHTCVQSPNTDAKQV